MIPKVKRLQKTLAIKQENKHYAVDLMPLTHINLQLFAGRRKFNIISCSNTRPGGCFTKMLSALRVVLKVKIYKI